MAATVGQCCSAARPIWCRRCGPETLSVSSYLLSGYMKRDARSSGLTLKYLLVGSAAAAVFTVRHLAALRRQWRLHQP